MNRLTRIKNHYGDYEIIEESFSIGEDENQQCLNKLGQYEDIEELCEKIKTHPVYQKLYTGAVTCDIIEDKFFDCSITYNFEKKRIEIYQYEIVDELELDEYGTQWAFSREELEK